MEKKMQRDEQHKMIAGVCAGLAEYLNVDVTLVRVIFVVVLLLKGVAILPYIVLWIVMPKKVYDPRNPLGNVPPPFANDPTVDYSVPKTPFTNPYTDYNMPPQQPGAPFAPQPKKASSAGIIAGIALIAFGSFFLLDEFDFLPDWDFERLWPLVIIIAGLVLVFSRKQKNPWDKKDWRSTEQPATETKEESTTATGENPPSA